jgi:hypothetical protein
MKLRPGDMVIHSLHGIGRIVEEWGSWWACARCNRRVSSEGCDKCNTDVPPMQIAGGGVFDVTFRDKKTYSIHKRLLTPLR